MRDQYSAADAAAAGTLDSFAPRFADLASEKEMADTDRPLVYILIVRVG